MITNTIKIYATPDYIQATTISSLLECHGIKVFQLNKTDSSYPCFAMIELFIPLEDEQEAIELLANECCHE